MERAKRQYRDIIKQAGTGLEDMLSSVLFSLNVPSYTAVGERQQDSRHLHQIKLIDFTESHSSLKFYTIEPVSFSDACLISFLESNCEVLPRGQR